jgi:hypothetical protein
MSYDGVEMKYWADDAKIGDTPGHVKGKKGLWHTEFQGLAFPIYSDYASCANIVRL